ncbi:ComF family protein [Neptunomonas antarctica]|uniref:ComF family protein n=1 Tax=Neptunomonas antarctica TaxID=619304 RepID=A0A1N7JFQ6_9GAMM|nr:ComF family protein [Neptunomonas antarctica]SIS48140.1 comF family protein [Neptunomonas antarctica]
MLAIFKNICTNNKHKCALCGESTHISHPLCENCLNDLPWLATACYVCALPLSSETLNIEARGLEQTDSKQKPLICGQCIKEPPAFSNTQAAFYYRFPISAIIPKIKHHHGLHHTTWLAQCLLKRLLDRPQAWPEAIIPVPVHPFRLMSRGFNQSTMIARYLSQQLKIPLLLNRLQKIKHTKSQSRLTAKQRRANLDNAFSYNGPILRHVVLIDDVVTTGTTIKEISKILKNSGIERVDIWVIARTPAPD